MTEENKAALEVETTEVVDRNTTVDAREEAVAVELPEKYAGKSVEDVIKMHQEAEKLIGKKAKSAPEQYVLPEEFDIAKKDDLLNKAKELDITQDQMKEIADILIEENNLKSAEAESLKAKSIEENKAELESIFGEAFDERKKEFEELSTKYAGEEMTTKLKELAAFENPVFMKFFDKINTAVLKHTTIGSDYVERKQTPAEAAAKIKALQMDKEFMETYTNKRMSGHNEAVEKLSELYRIAHS